MRVWPLVLLALVWCSSVRAEVAELPPSHSVKPELYATGFSFAEGPALDRGGNLYVVNYRNPGTIGRIGADGAASIFCDLQKLAPVEGRRPQANGLKLDTEGRLIVADSGAGRLLRVAADGSMVEVLADRCDAQRFQAINDVALDVAGNNPIGCIYRYDIRTKKCTLLAKGLAFPNGLGLTPDQKHLVLAESARFRLLIFDVAADGSVSNQRVLIDFPTEDEGNIRGGKFEPDGLIFDALGRCYVGMWSGGVVNVVDVATGKLVRQYDAGGLQATNCHFHGGYLYVTVAAKEAVFRLKLDVEGFSYVR
jgi:gluconolactonase